MKPLRRVTPPSPCWDMGRVVRNVGLALALVFFVALLAPIVATFGKAYGRMTGLW